MNFRLWIPHGRVVAVVLAGLTAIIFVATGLAALAAGIVPPRFVQFGGTFAAFAGLIAVVAMLVLERRRKQRRQAGARSGADRRS